MGEFDAISEKYCRAGISIDNIEYARTAVQFGTEPNQIIENLKVGYKSMSEEQATALLQDLFIANKIEMKRKRRGILALGLFYSLVGFACLYYIFHVLIFGGVLHRSFFVILVAIGGISGGLLSFSRLIKNNADAGMRHLAH